MKHFHLSMCRGCGTLTLLGPPALLANAKGVTRRTIYYWITKSLLHAQPSPTGHLEACFCSLCPDTPDGPHCEHCRAFFLEEVRKRVQMCIPNTPSAPSR
jgi:hypothetical protein